MSYLKIKNNVLPTFYPLTNFDGYGFCYASKEEADSEGFTVIVRWDEHGDPYFKLYRLILGELVEVISHEESIARIAKARETGKEINSGLVTVRRDFGAISWMLEDAQQRFNAISLLVQVAH